MQKPIRLQLQGAPSSAAWFRIETIRPRSAASHLIAFADALFPHPEVMERTLKFFCPVVPQFADEAIKRGGSDLADLVVA